MGSDFELTLVFGITSRVYVIIDIVVSKMVVLNLVYD